MHVDCFIFIEEDTLVVEYPFCSLYFDKMYLESKAYDHFKGCFEHAECKYYDEVLNKYEYHINFNLLDNDDKHDIIYDLVYYYNVKPSEIAIITENQIKTYK